MDRLRWPWDMHQIEALLASDVPRERRTFFVPLPHSKVFRIVIGADDKIYRTLGKQKKDQPAQGDYTGTIAYARDAYLPWWTRQRHLLFTPLAPRPDAPNEQLQSIPWTIAIGIGSAGLHNLEVITRIQAQTEVLEGKQIFQPETVK